MQFFKQKKKEFLLIKEKQISFYSAKRSKKSPKLELCQFFDKIIFFFSVKMTKNLFYGDTKHFEKIIKYFLEKIENERKKCKKKTPPNFPFFFTKYFFHKICLKTRSKGMQDNQIIISISFQVSTTKKIHAFPSPITHQLSPHQIKNLGGGGVVSKNKRYRL